MRSFIVSLILLSLANILTAKDCEPIKNDCGLYQCLESKIPCGPNGYAIGYGKFYCDQFTVNRSKFTSKGQNWLTSTMYCLQKALKQIANDTKKKACSAIKTFAFDSHPSCYTQPGSSICDLSTGDWYEVVRITRNNLLDSESLSQMYEVAKTCGSQYIKGITDIFF